jgi:hypothetical protein
MTDTDKSGLEGAQNSEGTELDSDGWETCDSSGSEKENLEPEHVWYPCWKDWEYRYDWLCPGCLNIFKAETCCDEHEYSSSLSNDGSDSSDDNFLYSI